ncbi:hypothetical protein FKW77_006162 [Venturia effusa]|uniref:Amino acid permease/ SLC12A domain-containing protein n=1 Tax=Venturia effusa TaxID=50376 RepID=A0A517LQ99_9PEZI|nr:hypothetical protein FKW77_006162 [Venturia effusa]
MEQRTTASQTQSPSYSQSQSQSQSRTDVPTVTADDVSSIDDAVFDIRPENIPNTIITKAPAKQFRLGTWTVIGLVINRMIGTGIFNSPSTVIKGTGSVGAALLFWFAGALFTIAGTCLIIEFGLTIPRYVLDGIEQGIPRSGGTLNYLQYVFPYPAYRSGSVLLVTCVFGAAFIIMGNEGAGNSLGFGIRIVQAAGHEPADYDATVRGIAVAVATLTCLIHTFSRRGGIWLGNLFALIKVLLLTLMVILGFCAWGGAFKTKNYVSENMAVQNAFAKPATEPFGYVSAFLSIIFAWTGFDQPTYVLGEIGTPRKTFPRGTGIGVAIVVVLYMLVNVAYMIVVPKELQLTSETGVASEFFKATLSHVGSGKTDPVRILAAFMAISSFGNIMVMTFVAARVKQEIAKSGILPFAKFFGQTKDLSLGRLLSHIQRKDKSFAHKHLHFLLKQTWMTPSHHTQETPFGALFLHWFTTIVMLLVTISLKPRDAYGFLVDVYSYTVVCFFSALLGIGMLKLRSSAKQQWRKKSPTNPFLSIISAMIFLVGSAYPLVAAWVPPTGKYKINLTVPWFTTPTVAVSILGFGVLWYGGFVLHARRRSRREGLEFQVKKVPEFDRDGGDDGLPVQVHETVYMAWAAKEARNTVREVESRSSYESF